MKHQLRETTERKRRLYVLTRSLETVKNKVELTILNLHPLLIRRLLIDKFCHTLHIRKRRHAGNWRSGRIRLRPGSRLHAASWPKEDEICRLNINDRFKRASLIYPGKALSDQDMPETVVILKKFPTNVRTQKCFSHTKPVNIHLNQNSELNQKSALTTTGLLRLTSHLLVQGFIDWLTRRLGGFFTYQAQKGRFSNCVTTGTFRASECTDLEIVLFPKSCFLRNAHIVAINEVTPSRRMTASVIKYLQTVHVKKRAKKVQKTSSSCA
uniref:Uncharacterized protein n=1 Tax=Romanomermis culicivorax TaxID=13658 RepID=A0A915KBH4_ROMCU